MAGFMFNSVGSSHHTEVPIVRETESSPVLRQSDVLAHNGLFSLDRICVLPCLAQYTKDRRVRQREAILEADKKLS
ncbi:hypothetical protein GLOTRDRAFT_129378 [Gloeophyllum trabeum ATCC 11539]|uniref:Uncharacterized protein n=1 Tax=Gloeophyllum trabeum (strain ATCC 11539 / FP-39264 / Madison 617) TaxID=670483 RepID=S7Q4Y4_GLOTA|nr:uncharacterized protein GLOTRDRAFT_129378 [Gloeophyllum trabeum ATCC 11539]EPQ55086.1 hypothetical protein GLOTRDRAFT_129378 [Gloeophyllum trabeum ATCC 11539]